MAWLFQRPDSGRWWIGYRQNGTQVRKSTRFTDKGLAEVELRKVEAMLAAHEAGALTKEFYEAISGRAIPNVTLKASLEQWLTEARGAAGDRTVEKYQGLADSIIKHFHATDSGPLVS